MVYIMPRCWKQLLALSLLWTPAAIANLFECVPDGEEFDPDRDYFPDKAEVQDSKFWEIQYFNNFKVLTNEVAGETHVLYQCGTPSPTIEELRDLDIPNPIHIIPVPLQHGITLGSTTHITLLELLGLRTEIKAWVDPYYYDGLISSPCLGQLIDEGEVMVISDTSNQTAVDSLLELAGPSVVSFHNWRGAYSSALFNVTVSAYTEFQNKAIGEWIKFFAVFFNKEKKATQLHDFANARYDCTAAEAENNVAVSTGVRPTVIWASWTSYNGIEGWSVGKTSTYYSEYANACSADLITSREGTIEFFNDFLFTTEDFVALAKDADIWIYSSPYNWDTAKTLHANAISGFKSVQNEKVFDVNGGGSSAWFENRVAEYDVVLEDFCAVVGTADPLHKRIWLRNVFTENVGANALTTCKDPTATLVPRYTPCQLPERPASLCFSGENVVNVKTSSSIVTEQMKNVKIGDLIQTGESVYEKVYGFGHFQPNDKVPFLKVFLDGNSAPLEISEQHMVFVEGGRAIPASHLKAGDRLNSDGAVIRSVKKAYGVGAFAPFTPSGTVMVNGVKASSFVSLQNSEYFAIAGFSTGLTHQWIAHTFELPHRLWCLSQANGVCTNERYNSDGISADWVAVPHQFFSWFVTQASWLQLLLGVPLVITFLALGCVSMLTATHLCAFATILVGLKLAKSMQISCRID